jgi:hypothetical protein
MKMWPLDEISQILQSDRNENMIAQRNFSKNHEYFYAQWLLTNWGEDFAY